MRARPPGSARALDHETAALFAVGLTLLALLVTAAARRTPLPDPVVLCLAGMAASALPGSA